MFIFRFKVLHFVNLIFNLGSFNNIYIIFDHIQFDSQVGIGYQSPWVLDMKDKNVKIISVSYPIFGLSNIPGFVLPKINFRYYDIRFSFLFRGH